MPGFRNPWPLEPGVVISTASHREMGSRLDTGRNGTYGGSSAGADPVAIHGDAAGGRGSPQ